MTPGIHGQEGQRAVETPPRPRAKSASNVEAVGGPASLYRKGVCQVVFTTGNDGKCRADCLELPDPLRDEKHMKKARSERALLWLRRPLHNGRFLGQAARFRLSSSRSLR